jgi:hypothetical protein
MWTITSRLDGLGSFHVTGIIAAVTAGLKKFKTYSKDFCLFN